MCLSHRITMLLNSNKNFTRKFQNTRSIKQWVESIAESFKPKDTHMVRQIGDPVLRQKATPVDLPAMCTPEFKAVCDRMVETMRRHYGGGIAAPQIGVPLQIMAVEFTGHDLKVAMDRFGSAGVSKLEMSLFPLKIMVNPRVKIIDPTMTTFREGCLSVKGYRALVPRAREIEVTCLNTAGTQETFRSHGWTARIIQHEHDHLLGNIFVDSMIYKSLTFEKWKDFVPENQNSK